MIDDTCIDCLDNGQCYEHYILSGQEERDLIANNASDEEFIRLGYKPQTKVNNMIYQTIDIQKILNNIPEIIKKSFENDNRTLRLYDLLTWHYNQGMNIPTFGD